MTKQLTQDVFKDAPPWVKSAAVDACGHLYGYSTNKSKLLNHKILGIEMYGKWYCSDDNSESKFLGTGYDTTNWQHSAIDRE